MEQKFQKIIFLLAFLLFAILILNIATTVQLHYDSAHQAIVSKNLAKGFGGVETYHGKVILSCLTTGLTVLLPGALLIALLGNQIWVPGFAVCCLNLALLTILAYQMRKVFTKPGMYYSFLVGLLGFFLYYDNFWWGYYLGEISSFLLLLIACAYYAVSGMNKTFKHLFCFGLILGIALNAKLIVLPGVIGVSVFIFFVYLGRFFQKKMNASSVFRLWGALVFGVVVSQMPAMLLDIFNVWQDGRYSYWEYLQYRQEFISTKSSPGLGMILSATHPLQALGENLSYQYGKIEEIFRSYGLPMGCVLLAFLAILVLGIYQLKNLNQPESIFIALLFSAFVFYLIWYFIAAHIIFERHALHVVLIFGVLLLLVLARFFSWYGIVPLLVMMVILLPAEKQRYLAKTLTLSDPSQGKFTLYNRYVQEANHYIEGRTFKFPLANCGWMGATREIEFLLSGVDNFKDCYKLIEEALVYDEKSGHYDWSRPVNFTLLINNVTWAMGKTQGNNRKMHPVIVKACEKNILFENPLYRLMECHFDDLQKRIPLDKETPFVNIPEWWRGH